MEKVNEETKIEEASEPQKPQGMTREQLQAELDIYESQLFAEEQKLMMNKFDLSHRMETIERNIRQNNRVIARVSSNIEVTKKEMSELKD